MQFDLISDMTTDELMVADEAEALKDSYQIRGDGKGRVKCSKMVEEEGMLRESECSNFSWISIIFKGRILARLLAGYQKSSKKGQIMGDITRPNAFHVKGG